MARVPSRRPSLDGLTAAVSAGGVCFPFRLCARPLALGPDLTVQYYWMDSSQFRIPRARRGSSDPANLRACVGHWWRATQVSGRADDPDQVRSLLLAAAYGLVGADKGSQRVYRDAHLAPEATRPEERSLPDEVRSRLRSLVREQDAVAVGEEMDRVLGAWSVPERESAAVRQTVDGILAHGVELVRDGGSAGLERFLAKFDGWCADQRRRGGHGFLRRVLDGLSYLAQTSFYLCYANAWVALIPWLRDRRGLDAVSERFLRFWHMQNQPVRRPDGTHAPDALRGQVLSLHPLSGFFMRDPGLCAVAGRFFGSEDAYASVFLQCRADRGEYWDLVGAILTAGHLYRQALDEQQQRRGVRQRPLAEGAAAVQPSEQSAAGLLEEYATARGLRCPSCGGAARLREHRADPEADGVCRASFTCPACGGDLTLSIGQDELAEWLGAR